MISPSLEAHCQWFRGKKCPDGAALASTEQPAVDCASGLEADCGEGVRRFGGSCGTVLRSAEGTTRADEPPDVRDADEVHD